MIWKKTPQDPSLEMVSLLGTSARFVGGNLKLCHDVRIDGEVEADLEVEGRAIISKSGSVRGRIEATNLVVAGEIHGDIDVHQTLVLKETARVYGTVVAQDIITEKGASGEMSITVGEATGRQTTAEDDSRDSGHATEAELVVMGDVGNPANKLKPIWKSGVRILDASPSEKVLPEDSDDASRGRFW